MKVILIAIELPKGLRINVVSPTMLKESESQYLPSALRGGV
jgi:hypothetical protein